jgi:hypothetical protein
MKILKFNELAGATYKSVMDRVGDKGDPKSARMYNDARKLRSQYYSKEPLKIMVAGNNNVIDFRIHNLDLTSDKNLLRISCIVDNKEQVLNFDIRHNGLTHVDSNGRILYAYVNRKGANIISKILTDYNIEVRPQDIPQF